MNAKIPVVVVRGSDLSNQICDMLDSKSGDDVPRHQPEGPVWNASDKDVMLRLVHSCKAVPSSNSSEEAASIIHLLLTISL